MLPLLEFAGLCDCEPCCCFGTFCRCHFGEDVWILFPFWFQTTDAWLDCAVSFGSRGRCFFSTADVEEFVAEAVAGAEVVLAEVRGGVEVVFGGLETGWVESLVLGLEDEAEGTVEGETDGLAAAGSLPE